MWVLAVFKNSFMTAQAPFRNVRVFQRNIQICFKYLKNRLSRKYWFNFSTLKYTSLSDETVPLTLIAPGSTQFEPHSVLLLFQTTRKRENCQCKMVCSLVRCWSIFQSSSSLAPSRVRLVTGPQWVCYLALTKWTEAGAQFWADSQNGSSRLHT